ncbi:MAG: signal peptidase I [Candidatus Aenigmarchaeota archaeon]|nr:signal peptidase I [Candidatus Aenigmarchaeota archaeon]
MAKGDSALSTLGYIVLGIIIAYAINLGLSVALNTSMPVVAVESNSMVPTFSRGDILFLVGKNTSELKVWDIIVYSPEGQSVPIVHRIIAMNPDGTFQTKGDANAGQLAFEKRVEPAEIRGVVIFIIPFVGWIKIAVTSFVIPNLLWIIVALAVAFAALQTFRYLKRSDKI